ncbi:MAG TPA: hypothetical protein VKF39_00800, partial [Nitrososphaerales archaeon]|nr:hypothetical protein [Nitrososphaerales archaeon]
MIGRQVILAVMIVALLGAGLFTYYEFGMPSSGCSAPNAPVAGRYQALTIRFGAVTEYCLDNPSRWSNGIFVAPDGSVWFGEQAVPGLGHLFTNGTVVEYPWPGYHGGGSVSSSPTSSIWGVVAWNGRIWAADGDANKLFGFDPADRSTISVNATGAPFPYLLTPAPDGSLWFTTLSAKPLLASLGTDLSLTVYPVSGIGKEEPIQVLFENSTLAYMVALNPDSTTGEGGLYSFDPQTSTGTIA